jgi:phenylacetic acid degradation operon negative regulatory protein
MAAADGRGNGSHARSLLLTVLGEYVAPRRASTWTGTLVEALGTLGVREKAARQVLLRSATDGWLVGERHGRRVRFELSPEIHDLLAEGAGRIYSFGAGRVDWDGRWLVVVASVPEEQRHLRHKLRTGLAWAGFGPLGQGVWVCPDAGREEEARRVVESLGPSVQATSFVGRHAQVGDESALVARAWNLSDLERRYDSFLAEFGRARPAGDEDVFRAQTRLVHEWRRFLFLDPGLPDTLLPSTWPGRRARELFLRRHDEWASGAQSWFQATEARSTA